MNSRRDFLCCCLYGSVLTLGGLSAIAATAEEPFLIVNKVVDSYSYLMTNTPKPPSGTLIAAWRSGRVCRVESDDAIGNSFVDGIVDKRLIEKIRNMIEHRIRHEIFTHLAAIHGEYYELHYQQEMSSPGRRFSAESPNAGKTGTEQIVSFVRNLQLTASSKKSGSIFPTEKTI